MIYLCLIEPVLWVNLESGTKCFVFEAEIEDEGVLSFPAPLLFAAIIESYFKPCKKAQLHQVGDILEQILKL